MQITYPDGETAIVRLRPNGNFDVVKDDSGMTTWNVPAQEVEDIIRQRQREVEKLAYAIVAARPRPKAVYKDTPAPAFTDLQISAALMLWIETNLCAIFASVRAAKLAEFVERYMGVTGEVYTGVLPGVRTTTNEGRYGDTLEIVVAQPLPAQFAGEVEALQQRCGKRLLEPMQSGTCKIWCNNIAWELLRRGYRTGDYR